MNNKSAPHPADFRRAAALLAHTGGDRKHLQSAVFAIVDDALESGRDTQLVLATVRLLLSAATEVVTPQGLAIFARVLDAADDDDDPDKARAAHLIKADDARDPHAAAAAIIAASAEERLGELLTSTAVLFVTWLPLLFSDVGQEAFRRTAAAFAADEAA